MADYGALDSNLQSNRRCGRLRAQSVAPLQDQKLGRFRALATATDLRSEHQRSPPIRLQTNIFPVQKDARIC